MKTQFTINDAIDIDYAPAPRTGRGMASPFISIWNAIEALPEAKILPVTIENAKSGYSIAAGIRRMAKKANKVLNQRLTEDGKTIYFWLTDKPSDAE